MTKTTKYHTKSSEETFELGRQLSQLIKAPCVIALFGDLGAGKTTFVKGFAEGLAISPSLVRSPTFQYLNIYPGKVPLYHFDLYRLRNAEDFLALGFDETFDLPVICVIEWAERIKEIIPKKSISIILSYADDDTRNIEISPL